jgi:hypothetical protein
MFAFAGEQGTAYGHVQVGQELFAVDGVAVQGKNSDDIVEMIRGPPGSNVKLMVGPITGRMPVDSHLVGPITGRMSTGSPLSALSPDVSPKMTLLSSTTCSAMAPFNLQQRSNYPSATVQEVRNIASSRPDIPIGRVGRGGSSPKKSPASSMTNTQQSPGYGSVLNSGEWTPDRPGAMVSSRGKVGGGGERRMSGGNDGGARRMSGSVSPARRASDAAGFQDELVLLQSKMAKIQSAAARGANTSALQEDLNRLQAQVRTTLTRQRDGKSGEGGQTPKTPRGGGGGDSSPTSPMRSGGGARDSKRRPKDKDDPPMWC